MTPLVANSADFTVTITPDPVIRCGRARLTMPPERMHARSSIILAKENPVPGSRRMQSFVCCASFMELPISSYDVRLPLARSGSIAKSMSVRQSAFGDGRKFNDSGTDESQISSVHEATGGKGVTVGGVWRNSRSLREVESTDQTRAFSRLERAWLFFRQRARQDRNWVGIRERGGRDAITSH